MSDLNKEIKVSKIDLKAAMKDKKDTSHNYEKKISELEVKNSNLMEFKTLKETDEKDLKAKLKNVNKKLKSLTEKESKLKVEKENFEKAKKEVVMKEKDDSNNLNKSCQTDTLHSASLFATQTSMVSHHLSTPAPTFGSSVSSASHHVHSTVPDNTSKPDISKSEVLDALAKMVEDCRQELKETFKISFT